MEKANGNSVGAKVVALILAAGFSERMGEFKPLLPIGDKPALERLVDSYKQAGVADIFVVTGHNREALLPLIEKAGAKEVYNRDFASGMFSSVKTGVKAVAEGAGVLLHPVDTPLVGSGTIRNFIDAIFQNPEGLSKNQARSEMFAVSCYMGKKGHPLFIPAKFFGEILAHDGERGLKGITSKYDHAMFRYESGDESVILDMDTKEAYREILDFYGKTHARQNQDWSQIHKQAAGRRIVFVRHGEIRQHKEKIFLGQYDPPLSDKGKDQAKEAGEALLKLEQKLESDRIYTSDLVRASETALIIGEITGLKILEEPGFREMSLGGWDGKLISRIRADFPELYERRGENLLTFKIDNESENYFDLRYRAWKSLERILEEDENKDIIIVSHGGTMRALLSILKESSLEAEMNTPIKNGEIIVFESTWD